MTDQLSREARGIIEAARGAEDPTADDRARVHRALALRLAAGGAGAAVGGKALAFGFAGKAVVAAVVMGALGVGAFVALRTPAPLAPAPAAEPAAAPRTEAPRPNITPISVEPPTKPAPTRPPLARPRSRDRVSVMNASSLAEETAFLAGVREALRVHEPARALAQLDEYPRRFPAGILREEHLATRVQVLGALGRQREACAAARLFLQRWPRSPQADRVRAACDRP